MSKYIIQQVEKLNSEEELGDVPFKYKHSLVVGKYVSFLYVDLLFKKGCHTLIDDDVWLRNIKIKYSPDYPFGAPSVSVNLNEIYTSPLPNIYIPLYFPQIPLLGDAIGINIGNWNPIMDVRNLLNYVYCACLEKLNAVQHITAVDCLSRNVPPELTNDILKKMH